MTVIAIRLENFMAFADTDWLALRPISLLFGRNSTGKSTIIRALRLLKQSLDQPEHQSPLRFVAEYGVDLGSFETAVHNGVYVDTSLANLESNYLSDTDKVGRSAATEQKEAKSSITLHSEQEAATQSSIEALPRPMETNEPDTEVISFHFRCEIADELATDLQARVSRIVEWEGGEPIWDEVAPEWLDMRIGFARTHYSEPNKQGWITELVEFELTCDWPFLDKPISLFSADRLCTDVDHFNGFPHQWSWSTEWHFSTDVLYGHKVESADWSEVTIDRTIGFLPILDIPDSIRCLNEGLLNEEVKTVQNIIESLNTTITDFLRSILYIGPIRPAPNRGYAFDQVQMNEWRQQGWGAYLDFLSGQKGNANTIASIGFWLGKLGLGPKVSPNRLRLGSVGFVASVTLQEVVDGVPVNLSDMGYGASQVLPIIVQALTAHAQAIVIIEQPELHLHPAAQAELGDLFIQLALSTEGDSQNALPRFILETHSETLILRVMRRMRNTTRNQLPSKAPPTSPHDVSVFVTNRSKYLASTIHRMDIAEDGKLLEPWPGGFFEEGFRERSARGG